MARSKAEVERIREHLGIAAKLAAPTRQDVAQTLLALREDYRPRVPVGTTNVTLMVPTHLRAALQDAAVQRAVETGQTQDMRMQQLLGAVVSAGIPRVLAGETSVREIPRDPRGTSAEKVNVNVAVASDVLAELRAALPVLRLGFEGKPSVTKIALRLLLDEYGLEYEVAPSRYKELAQVQLQLPPRLARAIRKKLDVVDVDLPGLVEEGYRKVLDGSWKPLRIPKAAKGSDYVRESISPRVDPGLLEQVRAKCPALKQELGYPVTAPTIAIDYLISELGLEDLADKEYGITAE